MIATINKNEKIDNINVVYYEYSIFSIFISLLNKILYLISKFINSVYI